MEVLQYSSSCRLPRPLFTIGVTLARLRSHIMPISHHGFVVFHYIGSFQIDYLTDVWTTNCPLSWKPKVYYVFMEDRCVPYPWPEATVQANQRAPLGSTLPFLTLAVTVTRWQHASMLCRHANETTLKLYWFSITISVNFVLLVETKIGRSFSCFNRGWKHSLCSHEGPCGLVASSLYPYRLGIWAATDGNNVLRSWVLLFLVALFPVPCDVAVYRSNDTCKDEFPILQCHNFICVSDAIYFLETCI
jgi:hypothetical protein